MDLIEAAEYHRRTLERLNRSPATLRLYRIYHDAFLVFLVDNGIEPKLGALTPQLVRECQSWLRSRSRGKRGGMVSEKALVTCLKTWSRFLYDQEVYDLDPLARLKVPRVPKIRRKPFTQEEAQRLLAAATAGANPLRDRALLLLMLDTGCRVGELCAARLEDLDLQEGAITFNQTKGGNPRTVIFRVQTRRDGGPSVVALKAWMRMREAAEGVNTIFTTRQHFGLSPRRVRELFSEWGNQAHVPDAHPHRTRHTAASSFLAERPGAEIQLRSRLGQVSHEVLADYVTISDKTAVEAAGVASLSSKWGLSGRASEQANGAHKAPAAAFCPACGFQRAAEYRFCAGCGKAFEKGSA